MRKIRLVLPLLLAAAIVANLLFPASYGRTSAADADPYWTLQEQVHRALNGELVYGSMLLSVDTTPDGRYVVFESAAQAMYATGTGTPNNTSHVYVHDRLTGKTSMLDTAPDGTPANADGRRPVISDDGSRIAFESLATNLSDDPGIAQLAPDDLDNYSRIYVYERTAEDFKRDRDTLTLASVNEDGEAANQGSYNPAISGDGRVVAYESGADNLTEAADSFAMYSIYTYLRENGGIKVRRVSDPEVGSAFMPAIDEDGDSIAYWADVYRENSDDYTLSRYAPDFYLYRAGADGSETRTLLNAVPDLTSQENSNPAPAISADGMRVVFASAAELTAGGSTGKQNVYLYDAAKPDGEKLRLISKAATAGADAPAPSDGNSYDPDISPDGRHVGFVSDATDLRTGLHKKFTYNPLVLYDYDIDNDRMTNLGGLDNAASGQHPSLSNAGFAYTEGSSVAVALSPGDAPVWPDGASVAGSEEAGGSIVLSWPGAAPAGAVRYKVYQIQANPLLGSYYTIESLIGSTAGTSFTVVSPPADKTKLSYRIEAVSAVYNTSTGGPVYTYGVVGGQDVTPPTWPANAAGEQSAVAQDSVAIAWPAASDNTGVAGYRVYRSATDGEYVQASATTYRAEGLTPDTDYVFYVAAVDAAGNESVRLGPITARTSGAGGPVSGELTVTAQPNGNVLLAWTAAGSAERYEVIDATDAASPRVVGEADGRANSFTVKGLKPSSAYKFRIAGYAGSAVVYETLARTVTTPAQPVGSVALSRVNVYGGAVPIGAAETISLRGQAGLTSVATVTYTTWLAEGDGQTLLGTPREATAAISLTESAEQPGLYTAAYTFAEGVEKLTKLEARQTYADGTTTPAVQAPGMPIAVQAGLKLTVSSTQSLAGYKVNVSGPGGSFAQSKAIEGDVDSAVLTFDRLKGGQQMNIRLLDARDRVVHEIEGSAARSGLIAERQIDVDPPRALRLHIADDQGPLRNTWVVLTAKSGQAVWEMTDDEGATGETLWPAGSSPIKVEPQVQTSHYRTDGIADIVLDRAVNERTVIVERRPWGIVRGKVTRLDGSPAESVSVQLTIGLSDGPANFSATTDAAGNYSISAPAGAGKLVFRGEDGATTSQAVALAGNDTVTANAQVKVPPVQKIKINLYTRYAGGQWQGPLPIDWTTGIHLNIQIGGFGLVTSETTVVRGYAGDKILVSADGREGGLSADRQEIVLKEGTNVVDLRLEQTGVPLSAKLALPAGGAAYIGAWIASLERLGDDGEWLSAGLAGGTSYGYGEQLKLIIPSAAGQYRLTVTNGLLRSSAVFTLHGQEIVDLGTLRLTGEQGIFAGREGTELTAYPPELAPGQTAKLRLSYRAGADARRAVLLADIPAGTKLVPQSVVLNGAAAAYSIDGNVLSVQAGDITAGQAGWLTYQIELQPGADRKLAASGRIVFGPDGDRRTELGGSVELTNEPLSISGPAVAASLSWNLEGRAPAGANVAVYASGIPIGEAVAGPGGYWRLNASVPDPKGARVFELRAESELDGERLVAQGAAVQYDPDRPSLRTLTLEQSDGRRVSLDVSNGPVRFPYVVVPGRDFHFEATFNHPERVDNVQVHLVANGRDVAAPAELRDGVYYAAMNVSGTMTENIYVTYDIKSAGQPRIDSEADFKAALPPGMRSYGVTASTAFEADASGALRGSADIKLPAAGDLAMHVDLSLERGAAYTPTAEELAQAEALGVEAYGVGYTFEQGEDGQLGVSITAYVPESRIGNPGEAFALLASAAGAGTVAPKAKAVRIASAASGLGNLVKVGAKVLWNEKDVAGQAGKGAASIYDTKSAVDGRGQVADNMQALGDLADRIGECNPAMAGYFGNKINDLAVQSISVEAAKWGMMIAGAVLAPATFGGSLALMGASMAIGAALDANISHQTERLTDLVNKSGQGKCEPDDQDGGVSETHLGNPVATPVWIYDPSGYVYETFPDNRVAGAKATVYYRDGASGSYVPWNADWYGQANPQTTDALGRYGWDVPPGKWQVVYEKAGYETARSAELDVPPPQMEVNVPMVSYAAPRIENAPQASVAADGGVVLVIRTDKYVAVDTLTNEGVKVTIGGQPLAGTVEPIDDRTDGGGVRLARGFRFVGTAQATATAGQTVGVAIHAGSVVSYAGTAMASDYAANVVLTERDTTAPGISSAVATADGKAIVVAFDEALDVASPLSRASFAVTGAPIAVTGADYGQDGRSVRLTLSVRLASGARAGVTAAAGAVRDAGGNVYGGGSAQVANQQASADAALASLAVEGYALAPAFSPETTAYSVTVPEGVSALRVKASSRDTGASVRVNGMPAGRDAAVSAQIDEETALVAVTAADGRTKRYYEIAVVRGSGQTGGPGSVGGGGSSADAEPVVGEGVLDVPAGRAGKLTFGDEAAVLFPRGALDRAFRATIAKAADYPALPSGATRLSAVFELAKNEPGQLAANAELRLKLTGKPKTGEAAAVYAYDERGGKWVSVGGKLSGDWIVAQTGSFGKFVVLAVPAEGTKPAAPPKDIAGHWAEALIEEALAKGIVSGYPDGTFRPNASVTRSEFAVLLSKALGLASEAAAADDSAGSPAIAPAPGFADAASIPAWAAPHIAAVAAKGWISGYEDGAFRGGRTITRAELAVIVARALGDAESAAGAEPAEPAFADAADIPAWARAQVAQAARAGLLQGRGGGRFVPLGQATRAEALKLVLALAGRREEQQASH